MKKVAIILSNINKALAFEWIADGLSETVDLHFILLNPGPSELEQYLRTKGIKVFPIRYRSKRDLGKAILQIRQTLVKNQIETVHAHLLDAGLAGLFAARLAGIKKRIYTRHHATSHHVYHPHAVRYDKLINRMAKVLVATSENVKMVLMLMEQVPDKKIQIIHHGFDLNSFGNPSEDQIKKLSMIYNPSGKKPVVGVISRYIELKGIQYTIQAFVKILNTYPDALLILANASGKYKDAIHSLLKDVPESSYKEIVFEKDLVNLYRLFDVHVHVPVDEHSEAFGQTYVEALASGIPSVFTLSGVAPEIIRHLENAMVVPFRDAEAIEKAVIDILENNDLRNRLTAQGMKDVRALFEIETMLNALKKLYET